MLRRPRRGRGAPLFSGALLLGLGAWLLALAARWPGVRRGAPGLAEASAAATGANGPEVARDEEEEPRQQLQQQHEEIPQEEEPLLEPEPQPEPLEDPEPQPQPIREEPPPEPRPQSQPAPAPAPRPRPQPEPPEEPEASGGLTALVLGLLALCRGLLAVWAGEQKGLRPVRFFQRARRITVQHASAGLEAANQGRLVHVQGLTSTVETLRDPLFGVEVRNTLKLRRKVEMFQWTEHAEVSGSGNDEVPTYSYSAGWHSVPVESSRFQGNQGPGHSNPQMPFVSEEVWANEAALGRFRLPARLLGQVSKFSPCTELELATMSVELPAEYGGLRFTQSLVEGIPYLVSRGAGAPPEIGDLRVRFERAPCEEVSVVAVQADDAFRPMTATDRIDSEGRICFDEDPDAKSRGCLSCLCCLPGSQGGRETEQIEEVFLIAPGRRNARQMLWAVEATVPRPRSWPNIPGLLCIIIGLGLLGGAVPELFEALPYAGGLVQSLGLPGVWAAALVLGATLGYCIAALAWFQARPCRALLWVLPFVLVSSSPYLYRYWQGDNMLVT